MPYDPSGPPAPCPPPLKLECVIVCDRYHDFLAKTLPHNKQLFDRIVVVTSPEDSDTRRVCEYWHVECICTDKLNSRWGKFCKGAGVNAGLAKLKLDGWVVHMDADIWLPPLTKIILNASTPDPETLYGMDRFIVKGYKAWAEMMELPALQQECSVYVHLNAFPLGERVMAMDAGGYVPIGFFQMWNPGATGIKTYPEEHTSAGKGDMVFAKQWKRQKRAFLPELVAYHLESEDSEMEANWHGRKTKPFTHDGERHRL